MAQQIQAKDVYDSHYKEAEQFLSHYPDGFSKNQAITTFYHEMITQYPEMQWFGIATFASATVGKGITLSDPLSQSFASFFGDLGMGGQMGSSIPLFTPENTIGDQWQSQIATLHNGLCFGNQEVFKNMFSVFHTYMEVGLNGLIDLQGYNKKNGDEFTVSKELIHALSGLEKVVLNPLVQEELLNYKINQVYGTEQNFAFSQEVANMFAEVAINVTAHEQNILEQMYEKKFQENGPKVGEVLSNSMHDPILALFLEQLEMSGPTISGQYIPFTIEHGNIGSYDDRMNYFVNDIVDVYRN